LCPSSPSPHSQRSVFKVKDCDQLLLPFAALTETATVEDGNNRASEPQRRRFQGYGPTPGGCELTRVRQNEKRKRSGKARVPPHAKLLVSREEAAELVSLSIRSIDYLLASKELPFRKIGTRTMIPLSALQAFARMHHPERIAS
jgi:excisionase family DNA binding protein